MSQDKLDERNHREALDFLGTLKDRQLRKLLDKYHLEMTEDMLEDVAKTGMYLKLREQGVPHVWAAGRACRTFARRVNSDGAFHEHARRRMQRWPAWQKERYFEMARKAGINTHGKYHISGIGAADDPAAWVSGPEDIRDVAKQRNLTIEGHVKHQGHAVPPLQVGLADDLVEEMYNWETKNDPDLAARCRQSEVERQRLRGLVAERYAPKSSSRAKRISPSA